MLALEDTAVLFAILSSIEKTTSALMVDFTRIERSA
jgi:hypothetical protein